MNEDEPDVLGSVPQEPWPWEQEESSAFSVSEEDLAEARELRELMLGLTRMVGWQKLVELAEGQVQSRRDFYELTPLKSMHDVPQEQFTKGEMAGIQLVLSLPANILEQANEVLALVQDDDEEQ